MADGALYDRIGTGYATTRSEEPRIARTIKAALGDAHTVLNVGAGTGSYEPGDREVVAVEPSAVMIAQRARDAARGAQAEAEDLPFANSSFDAVMRSSATIIGAPGAGTPRTASYSPQAGCALQRQCRESRLVLADQRVSRSLLRTDPRLLSQTRGLAARIQIYLWPRSPPAGAGPARLHGRLLQRLLASAQRPVSTHASAAEPRSLPASPNPTSSRALSASPQTYTAGTGSTGTRTCSGWRNSTSA